MSGQVTESQLYMWRAVFAMAHADNIVTKEEIRYMVEALEDVPFSKEQRDVLTADIAVPQSIEDMFLSISDPKDRLDFFKFAREIVWIDGHYAPEEQKVLLKLKELHMQSTDVDDLVGSVELELEENEQPAESVEAAVHSFRDRFLSGLFGPRD